jgi:hypothetical protein
VERDVPPWPVRFVASAIVYWLLAPFISFGADFVWHVVESVAFGIVGASIPVLGHRDGSRKSS